MNKHLLFLVLAMIGLTCYSQQSALDKARACLKNGDTDCAFQEINEASKHPETKDSEQIHVLKGDASYASAKSAALAQVGHIHYLAAVESYLKLDYTYRLTDFEHHRTLQRFKTDGEAHLAKLRSLAMTQEYLQFETKFHALYTPPKVEEVAPVSADYSKEYAEALGHMESKDYSMALVMFEECASAHYRVGDSYFNMYQCAKELEWNSDAVKALREGSKEAPDHQELNQYYAVILLSAGQCEDAGKQIAHCAERFSGDQLTWGMVNKFKETCPDLDKAIAQHEAMVSGFSPFHAHRNLGELYMAKGDTRSESLTYEEVRAHKRKYYGLAVKHLEKAYSVHPDCKLTNALMAKALIKVGDRDDDAEKHFKKVDTLTKTY